jgi:putative sigma-54 modulation protein
MNTNVSFRHMEASPALRDYAEGKLERIVDKYVHGKVDASIVMSVEKFRHIANFTLKIKDLTVKGEESSQDMYSSIDLALDKIEKQLRRHKDRTNDHRSKGPQVPPRPFSMSIIPKPSGDSSSYEEFDEYEDIYEDEYLEDEEFEEYEEREVPMTAPAEEEAVEEVEAELEPGGAETESYETANHGRVEVVRRRDYSAPAMAVDEAVERLDQLEDREFFVFTNPASSAINIIYKRRDGNFGLIAT